MSDSTSGLLLADDQELFRSGVAVIVDAQSGSTGGPSRSACWC
jgi:hypothetical protein